MRKKQTNRQKIVICLLVSLVLVVYIFFIKSASMFRQVTTKKTELKERTELNINSWFGDIYSTCEGNVIAYGHEFFILKNVRLDQTNSPLFAVACEHVDSKPYFFYSGYEGTPMTEWMHNITRRKDHEELTKVEYTLTVALKRTEAHNIYHTLTEWFNVFVLSKHFKFDPKQVDIIFLDDRPPGAMDETWLTFYRRVYYAKNLPEPTIFKTLILSPIGYESPLRLPFLRKVDGIEEFSDYFLQAFRINERKKLNCAKLRVVIIWRHDYNSHPERAEAGGTIFRKIQNEAEVLQQLKDSLPGHEIIDILLENMVMKQQLQLMTHTDILIGMHGAGNAHTLFLPSHAVLFELFPLDSPYDKIQYFRAFCLWRNLTYVSWQNEDKNNDLPNYYTYVPPTVIDTFVKNIYQGLCSQ